MTTTQLYRWSGLALLIGMLLSAVSAIVSGIAFPDSTDPAAATNQLNVSLSVIGAFGALLALLGLPALYLRGAAEGGLVWLIGVVLIVITAVVFGIFLALTSAVVFPVLASRAPDLFREGPPPSFLAVFIVGTVANALGALLMGIAVLTKRIYPRWCGYLLIIETVLAVASFVVNGPSSSGLLSQVLSVISPLPLFVVLGWIGYELWSGKVLGREYRAGAVTPQPA